MNGSEISGFIIVRIPDQNFDTDYGPYFDQALVPKINGIYYAGAGRLKWDDIDLDYRNKLLPKSLQDQFKLIAESNNDYNTFEICQDFAAVCNLLDYANRGAVKNELLVLRSDKLSQLKNAFSFSAKKIDWLGYDVIYLRGWSLLESGLFQRPSHFLEWTNRINKNGLFDSTSEANLYLQQYQQLAKEDIVEDVPDDLFWIDIIELGRI